MNNQVAYLKYLGGFIALDGDAGYLAGYQPGWLSHLTMNGMWSGEVNIINDYIEKYRGTNKSLVDIGANEGTYTFGLGKVFNHVYSFEPSKHIYNILCGNIAIHGMSERVDAYNIGLYDETTQLEYVNTSMNGGGNYFDNGELHHLNLDGERKTLDVTTLDSYNITNIGLIKVDVEGLELHVLRGAVNTIRTNDYPEIILESWDPEQQEARGLGDYEEIKTLRDDLFSFLDQLGYTVECLDKSRDVYHAIKDHEDILKGE